MGNFNPDSYCGLYCGACDIHVSLKTGVKSRFARFWNADFLRKFVQANGIQIADKDEIKMSCQGCKSDEVFINCRLCRIRSCAAVKAVAHCTDCAEYPCVTYRDIGKAVRLLPHVGSAPENLAEIGEKGVGDWLSGQARRWSCPDCGAQYSWYAGRCAGCGKKLGNRTYKFTILASFIMKLALNSLARKQKASR